MCPRPARSMYLRVVSFIFADLIILPILDIYRKYYGRRMPLHLLAASYITMAPAGLVVAFLFRAAGLVPPPVGPSWLRPISRGITPRSLTSSSWPWRCCSFGASSAPAVPRCYALATSPINFPSMGPSNQ